MGQEDAHRSTERGMPVQTSVVGVNEEPRKDGQQRWARGGRWAMQEGGPAAPLREENKERMQQQRALLFLNSLSL